MGGAGLCVKVARPGWFVGVRNQFPPDERSVTNDLRQPDIDYKPFFMKGRGTLEVNVKAFQKKARSVQQIDGREAEVGMSFTPF